MGPLAERVGPMPDFFELAPENWIGVGGRFGKLLRRFTERCPFVAHGLSLSLDGPAPIDEQLLQGIKHFLDRHRIRAYSEHLLKPALTKPHDFA